VIPSDKEAAPQAHSQVVNPGLTIGVWVAALSLAAVAVLQTYEVVSLADRSVLSDEEAVWCHSNLALVGLAADALDYYRKIWPPPL
jgi:hypothetical protein